MDPQEFFRTLWGDPPPGVINIWRLPDRTSSWHRDLGSINSFLQQFAHEEVYTGVSLADPHKGRFTTKNRIEEVAAGAIAGVWADIDVFHPVHTKAEWLPANREEAQEVMDQLPYEPTLIVDSGHGLQYWWLLEAPWVFENEAEWGEARRVTQWWHRQTKALFEARGWTTDSVFDLSRVMRVPGTFNNKVKDDPKPVTAVKTGGPRYTVEDFSKLVPAEFVATLPVPEQKRGRRGRASYEASATSSGLIIDPNAEPSAVRLAALLKANPKFQQSWDQNRRDMKDPSPSGYNMSLADIAIRAGWPDQEVVNLLICWRRIHGHDLKLRERYYDLTLTRAKEPIQMEREQEKLEETLIHPPEDEPEVLKDRLDKLFKVDIIRIVKYLGNPPDFYMYTEQGDISIGPIANLASQPKFREAVMAATSVVIPKVSGAAWETRVQAILNMCEEEDLGEASHPEEETRTWVHDYLIERYVRSEDEWEKAAQRRFPFIKGDRIRIFLDDLGRWLDTSMGRKQDSNILAQRLKRIKAETERINLKVGGAKTTRSVWVLPEIFQPPVVGTDPGEDGPDGPDGPDGGPADGEGHDATAEAQNRPEAPAPDGEGPEATAPDGSSPEATPEAEGLDGGEDGRNAPD